MSNSDLAVYAENLSKIYKLYTSPGQKIRDMLGMLKNNKSIPTRNALNNVNLKIHKGERVCIIGRNGAGKSTLLKLISGLIKPSAGKIEVKGKAKALLQIGSGFYPELTGRDNVIVYLIQQGIREKDMPDLINEIIDFSEIEDYIDQPVKTYSSGMVARLMFATSTAISPDLLILDEILSVGDAYFTQKCIERVTQLCDSEDTTLVLVSHDIYSAAKLVERMIWIDDGEIEFDGKPKEILEVYESSVQLQEEKRLRKKSLAKIDVKDDDFLVNLELQPNAEKSFKTTIFVEEVRLVFETEKVSVNILNSPSESDTSGLILDEGNWGKITTHKSRSARVIKNYGSCSQKIGIYFKFTSEQLQQLLSGKAMLEMVVCANLSFELHGVLFIDNKSYSCCNIKYAERDCWGNINSSMQLRPKETADLLNKYKMIGSNNVALRHIRALNSNLDVIHTLKTGNNIMFELSFDVNDPDVQAVDIVLSLQKNGVETVCRYYITDFSLQRQRESLVTLSIDRLGLGEGEYTVALMITKAGYISSSASKFYSINPDVYYSGRDLYHLHVSAANFAEKNTVYVANAEWKVAKGQQQTLSAITEN